MIKDKQFKLRVDARDLLWMTKNAEEEGFKTVADWARDKLIYRPKSEPEPKKEGDEGWLGF